ncbi:MAG: IS256 family transposase [Thermoleophilaceae bacterium]|nr:IS256 family transposase [Actinomycetota bacterium]
MADTGSLGVRAELDKVLADEHADLLREGVALVLREVMEMEVARLAGADRYERSGERAAYRNGYRPRELATRVGTLELQVPKLRSGPSYLPSFLEARKRSEQALLAVVMEAYVNGVSTRKVERLVEQLGVEGMSKSTVSRICQGLDERGEAFRERPLEGAYPYLWLDARVERVREGAAGMVRQKALLVAYGVHETGRREVIGIAVGEVESESAWREFLRSLVARGLAGVQLAISDAHAGLRAAIGQVLGAQWQRCAVHFVRDMLGHVPRAGQPLVRGALKQIFAAPDRQAAGQTLAGVVEQLSRVAPKVARLVEAAEEELLAYMRFPREHWPKIRSTNPLERVNREIARRSEVVGIYPNDAALLRLVAGILVEVNDEWLVGHRYLSQVSLALLEPDTHGPGGPADAGQPALDEGALAGVGKSTT